MVCILGLYAHKREHGWVSPGETRKDDVADEKHV